MVKKEIIKFSRFLLLLALVFGITLIMGEAQAQEEALSEITPAEIAAEYAPGQLLVKFKQGILSSTVEDIEMNLGVSTLKTLPRINVRVMSIPAEKQVAEMIEALKKSPWVEYAEPNYICYKTVTVPDDTYFPYQWSCNQTSNHDIDAPEGWDITTGSSSIIIAIIDDGIDYNHEEFPSGKLWINPSTNTTGYDFAGTCNQCFTNKEDKGCTPDDDVMHESGSGHGTATAGIAAADTDNAKGIAGISWASVIMPLKVENSCGHIYHSYMADAITFAVDNGAHIISMSLGGPSSSATLENACRYAWENGTVIVVSSGNDNTEISYPARYPTTIAVGATNEIDNRIYPGNDGNEWAYPQGSNYGPELDVVAPGINIYATDWSAPGEGYDTDEGYYPSFGGTSASCPFGAGEAALLLAKDSSLSNERVRSIIRNSAEDQVGESSEDTAGFDIYYGYGRINLYNALSAPTKPDLTLTSSNITFSDDNPSSGETITISATIHNNGRDYSEISAINIGSQPNGAAPATADSYQLPYYPENANDGDYSTAWASASATGWVKIDLTNVKMIGRVYWHDTFFVSDNQPGDFTIKVSIDDVSYTTIDTVTGYTGNSYIKILGTPVQARYVKMEMTARTAGNAATLDELGVYEVYYDTVVGFYDGDPDSGGTQIGSDQHTSPVPASGTKSASVQWTATAGSHDIYVVVDPDGSIPESNETNNKAYKSLTTTSGTIEITAPVDISGWILAPSDGQPEETTGTLTVDVADSESWEVTATDEDGATSGKMTEWTGSAYGTTQLYTSMDVQGPDATVTLPNSGETSIASGTGDDFSITITFKQVVLWSDMPNITYRIIVTFTASITT